MNEATPKTVEALDKAVANIVEFSTDKGAKLIDWLYAQAPEVVEQLLTWHFAESFITCIICAFFIFVYPFALYKAARCLYVKFNVAQMRFPEGYWVTTVIFSIITLLVSQINGWTAINFNWLKIWLAPKVYLLEYITRIAADK
jgi:hypothetical protein